MRILKKSVRVADWHHQPGKSKGYWLIWEIGPSPLVAWTHAHKRETKMRRISKSVFDVLKLVLPSEG